MIEIDALGLLKEEMTSEEIHLKVNAIHRLKTVILSIGIQETNTSLIQYLDRKYSQHSNNYQMKYLLLLRSLNSNAPKMSCYVCRAD